MTMFGKVLVFFNVGISLLMATWAMAVYTNRVDWSSAAAKEAEGRPAGLLKQRQDEVRQQWGEYVPAAKSRTDAQALLAYRESLRAGDRDFYAREMYHLWAGATKADPARAVVFEGGHVALVPDPKRPADKTPNRPMMEAAKDLAGNPLLSLSAYIATEEKTLKELETVLNDTATFIQKDKDYTAKIIGPTGLQQRLVDERGKRVEVLEEQKLVRPLLINTYVDSELIVKRHEALKARVKELMGVKVAGRPR